MKVFISSAVFGVLCWATRPVFAQENLSLDVLFEKDPDGGRQAKSLRRLKKSRTKSPTRSKAMSKSPTEKSKSKVKAPKAENIQCNTTILSGYVEMDTDLACLSKPGLTLGENVVLDCKGHQITCLDSSLCEFGIQMMDGAAVVNCTVESFRYGILMNGLDNTVKESSIQDSRKFSFDGGHGITIDSQAKGSLTIDNVVSSDNGEFGLQVKPSAATLVHVVNSTFENNDSGIWHDVSGSTPKLIVKDSNLDGNGSFNLRVEGNTGLAEVDLHGKVSMSCGKGDGLSSNRAVVRFVDGQFRLNHNSNIGLRARVGSQILFESGTAQLAENDEGIFLDNSRATIMDGFLLDSSYNMDRGVNVRGSSSLVALLQGGSIQAIGNAQRGINAFQGGKVQSEPGSVFTSCENGQFDTSTFTGSSLNLLGSVVCDIGDPCTAGSCDNSDSVILDRGTCPN